MSVTEIIQAVEKLSPTDLAKVAEAIKRSEKQNGSSLHSEREAELLRRLQAKGLLKKIPVRRQTPGDFEPVPIEGRPLSETIIEERR